MASAFCIFHVLPMISIPLSMAILAKEKAINMLPMLLLQVSVNLGLDLLLIPSWGIPGAIAAVFGTYLLTIPVRLRAVKRLIGGIYFPIGFFLRILLLPTLVAAVLSCFAGYLNLPAYLALGAGYLVVYAGMIRVFRLVRAEEVAEFSSLGLPKLNRVLDLLVRGES